MEQLLEKKFYSPMHQLCCTCTHFLKKSEFSSINKKFILHFFIIKYESCVSKNEYNKMVSDFLSTAP